MTLCPLSVIIIGVRDKIYSTKEAAKELGLSPDHVKRLARDGVIKAQKLGHDWIILSLDYTRQRKPKIKRKGD